MTLGHPHPLGMKWDVNFRRDMSRLHKLTAAATGSQRVKDAIDLAEMYVKALHVHFHNPITGIEWHDGLFVLRLRMPSGRSANLALGSYGTAHYVVKGPQGHDDVSCPDGVVLINVLLQDLVEYGLKIKHMPKQGRKRLTSEPTQISRDPSSKVKVQANEKRSATVSRMKVRYVDEVDEDAIDRANAEVPTKGDDARIIKFKLDGGPGQTFVLHGIRKGLSGTSTQRMKAEHVSIEVNT